MSFCLIFITPILYGIFFPNTTLLGCMSNLTWLDFSVKKRKNQSSTWRTRLIFEFLLVKTKGTNNQVNCMMITSSMCPIQLFQTSFQLHCRINILILVANKNTLKRHQRLWNVFHAHFTMDPDLQSPVLLQWHNLK